MATVAPTVLPQTLFLLWPPLYCSHKRDDALVPLTCKIDVHHEVSMHDEIHAVKKNDMKVGYTFTSLEIKVLLGSKLPART